MRRYWYDEVWQRGIEVEGFILLNLYTMMLKISVSIFYLM